MIWRPRCIMKAVIDPASPSTITVPPFWSIPVRAPTLPWTTTSPPRSAAAVSDPALPSITQTPDIMFSHADQPTRPVMCTSGPSISPHAKYPRLPSKVILQRARMPTPSECLAPGLRTVTSCTPARRPAGAARG